MTQLQNASGATVTNRSELMDIATQFYKNLYKCTNENHNKLTIETSKIEKEPVPPFLESEIELSIELLKPGKSPGPDYISNEMIKTAKNEVTKPLTKLFNRILTTKEIPETWTCSEITLLYKKGDPKLITNYRPISLISCLYKVFASTLLRRITPKIDENQPVEQAGFMRNYSTVDHIHTLKIIIERAMEYNLPLYIAFIDYSKAFDSISHDSIWQALNQQGIDDDYIALIKAIYKNSTTRVRLEARGPAFPVERGVKQGDPLSPKLFIAVLESIFRNLEWNELGIKINGKYLSHLRFADDIVLLSDNPYNIKFMIESLSQESEIVGLQMNMEKTKLMTNRDQINIIIQSKLISYVEDYIYLGHLISFKYCTEKEINRRVKNTWNKYWALKEIFKGSIPTKLKTKAMNSCLTPVLTYACQTWPLKQSHLQKLKICQRGLERSYMNIKLKDRVRNSVIRKKTKARDVVKQILTLKWKWSGHIQRVTDGRWSQTVTNWYPRDKKRKKGRPLKRWSDDIVATTGNLWPRLAQDRSTWQSLEEAYTAKGGPYN